MPKRRRSKIEQEVDRELEAETKEEQLAEFDQSQALHVPAKKRESKLISIRLPITMIKELRDLAIKKGDVGYQQLIKIFISEGLWRARYETTSLSAVRFHRLNLGAWSNLDNSFSVHHDLQPPLSRTGNLTWK